MICRICGAVVGDAQQHLTWHLQTVTFADETALRDDCPLDGAPLAVAVGGDTGYTAWACGHRIDHSRLTSKPSSAPTREAP